MLLYMYKINKYKFERVIDMSKWTNVIIDKLEELKAERKTDLQIAKGLVAEFQMNFSEAYEFVTSEEIFKDFPQELKNLPQWVLWKKTNLGKRVAKLPYSLDDKNAKVNDSSTWSSYNEALEAYGHSEYDGIGFVFTENDDYVGIDIDHCISECEEINLQASRIVNEFNTYTEISQSGTGLHLLCKGKKPTTKCRSSIEIYEKARYFCITGNVLNVPFYKANYSIEERQEQIDKLCADF